MKKAFSLLELLVVIGIMAVLVGLATSAYSTVQKKARDARRKSDLTAFQKTLEQCYTINNYAYPAISGNGTTSVDVDCTTQGGQAMIITDPTTKTYTVTGGGGSTYSVSLTLEDGSTFTISQQQ